MGVKSVFAYKTGADVQAVDEITRSIELLQPLRSSRWTASCALYHGRATQQQTEDKHLFIFNFADSQDKAYMVLKNMALEADRDVVHIVNALKQYQLRQSYIIVGREYQVGDFVVRLGTVEHGHAVKGSLVEVEYTPCSTPNGCTELIKEFLTCLGPLDFPPPLPENFAELSASLPERYSPQHTAFQYLNVLKTLGLIYGVR